MTCSCARNVDRSCWLNLGPIVVPGLLQRVLRRASLRAAPSSVATPPNGSDTPASTSWRHRSGEASSALGFVAVSALVQATVLAIIINSAGATTVIEGLVIGLVLWLG